MSYVKPVQAFVILLLVGLGACNNDKHHENEIKRICITSTGGMKGHGFAITIDSSLNYFFKEYDWDSTKNEVFYGKVPRVFWDTLNMKIENIPEKQLDSIYGPEGFADCSFFEIMLTYSNKVKSVKFNGCDSRKDIMDFLNWVWNYHKTIAIKPCFEIKPLFAPPPQPLINELKVTPLDEDNSKHRHKKK